VKRETKKIIKLASAASVHIRIAILLLAQNIRARHMIKERIDHEVIKLFLIMKLCFFRNMKGLFPVSDLFIGLATVVPKAAVVNKKLAGDRFAFIRVEEIHKIENWLV
jgi:hypothetical protein